MTELQMQAVCSNIFFSLKRCEDMMAEAAAAANALALIHADDRMRKESIGSSPSTSTTSTTRTRVANLALFARRSDCSSSEDECDDGCAPDVTMAEKDVGRCVTPSYLDDLMNDSDATMSGSDYDDDDNDFDLDPAALVASMDPSSPYYHLNFQNGLSSADTEEILQSLVEFGRTPRMFDHSSVATMSFFISPLAISHLARGLWTRNEPACVIIHTRLPQRTSRFDDYPWSDDALRMLNLPNAGGSSLLSEVLSCEMLYRCLGARLAKTEMEIRYIFAYQPMTDYTISLPGLASGFHVGVSVTRAFAYKGAYRRSECRKLLKKKLSGITASTRNVMDERLFKQILHVWVPNGKVARTVQATYRTLPTELTRNSVVVISVVNAAWVFSNRR